MTTVSPVWNCQTLYDLNGNPLAGGYIYTYAANSWTVQQANGISNPIPLDENGQSPNAITLTQDLYYNMALYDAEGNLINVAENVLGVGVTPPTQPGTPSFVSTTPTSPVISWAASTQGSGIILDYIIWRSSTSSTTGFTPIATVGPTTYTYTDTDLTLGTPYWYYVTVVDSNCFYESGGAGSYTPSNPGWVLNYSASGGGNGGCGGGSGYSEIVSDDAGTYAMATGGPGTVSTSNGGGSWSSNSSFPSFYPPLSPLFNGTYFIAIDDFTGYIYFSTDLNTWTTNSVDYGVYRLVQDPTTLAIYFSPYTGTSNVYLYRIAPNSSTITTVVNNTAGPNLGTNVITANGVTICGYGEYPNYSLWYSSNGGVTWTQSSTSFTENILYDVAYNDDFGVFAVLTDNVGLGYVSQLWISTDGTTWTQQSSGLGIYYYLFSYGGYFINYSGTQIYTSPDGIGWTPQTLNCYIEGITITPTRMYVYGSPTIASFEPGIYESTDGITYTRTTVDYPVSQVVSTPGATYAIASDYLNNTADIYKRS